MILNVIDAVNKHLGYLAAHNDRDNTYFHASEWDNCKRRIAYGYYEAKGLIKLNGESKVNPVLQRIFGNGHYMHDRWKDYLIATGSIMGRWECLNRQVHKEPKIFGQENKLGCLKPDICECGLSDFKYREIGFSDTETMWGGHVDAVVNQKILAKFLGHNTLISDDEELILIDFKSKNDFAFKKMITCDSHHTTQMQIYLYLSGLKYGKFIYENKNDQTVKEYLVVRDDQMIHIKKSEAINLKHIVTTVFPGGTRKLPERAYSDDNAMECRSCKYRTDCWSKRHTENKKLIELSSQLVSSATGATHVESELLY